MPPTETPSLPTMEAERKPAAPPTDAAKTAGGKASKAAAKKPGPVAAALAGLKNGAAKAGGKKADKPAAPAEPEKPALNEEWAKKWAKWPKRMLAVNKIGMSKRFRKAYTRIPELAESINKNGLIHPPAVLDVPDKDGVCPLVAGGRRVKACEHLGMKEIPVVMVSPENEAEARQLALQMELDENQHREPMTFSETRELIAEVERMVGARNKGKPKAKDKAGKKVKKDEKRKEVEKYTGVSHEQARLIKVIDNAIRADPKKYGHFREKLDAKQVTVPQVYKEIKAATKAEQDGAGVPIHPKVADAFVNADGFRTAVKVARDLRMRLNELANDKGGERMVAADKFKVTTRTRKAGDQEIEETVYKSPELEALTDLLEESTPFCQCPVCAHRHKQLGQYDRKCPACSGGGTIGQHQYDELTKANDPSLKTLAKLGAEAREEKGHVEVG